MIHNIGHITRLPWLLFAALAASTIIFYHYPQLDMWSAKQLYNARTGAFILEGTAIAEFFRKPVDMGLKYGFLLALFIYLLIRLSPFSIPNHIKSRLNWLFFNVFLTVLVVVNGILKPFWGRARPSQIKEFGGNLDFSRAWEIVDQCRGQNCSFTSGHAALAASVVLLIVFLPKQIQRPFLFVAIIFYATASFMRMGLGAHFLSDVISSGMIVFSIAAITWDLWRKA